MTVPLQQFMALFQTKKLTTGTEVILLWNVTEDFIEVPCKPLPQPHNVHPHPHTSCRKHTPRHSPRSSLDLSHIPNTLSWLNPKVLVTPSAAYSYASAKPELRISSLPLCRGLFEIFLGSDTVVPAGRQTVWVAGAKKLLESNNIKRCTK